MAAQRKQNLLNLLPDSDFSTTTSGRIIAWILSTFRYIVIVVELVVVSSFLWRFWLDATITDLNDEVVKKQAIIEASAQFERDFRETQTKLTIFSELTSSENSKSQILTAVTSSLPEDAVLNLLSISDDGTTIEGSAFSETTILQYVVNLQASGVFEGVLVESVETNFQQNLPLKFTLKGITPQSEEETI